LKLLTRAFSEIWDRADIKLMFLLRKGIFMPVLELGMYPKKNMAWYLCIETFAIFIINQKVYKQAYLFIINMEEIYTKLFNEFLAGAIDEEKNGRYNSAISNYYKALSTLCSMIIYRKNRKTSNSHQEVDLFMSSLFPDIRKSIDGLYKTYTGTYQTLKKKQDCAEIKNGIKTVLRMAGIEEEFKETLTKI
jgi:hypothetical protein